MHSLPTSFEPSASRVDDLYFIFPYFHMMHTMTASASGPGFGFGTFAALHALGMTAVSLGILFFIFYVYKTFTHAELKKWALWLFFGGLAVCLLTIGAMHGTRWNKGMMNGNVGYRMMQIQDVDDEGTTQGMMKGGMGMSMNGMTMMLNGKTGDAFDAAFLAMMIPHHQGAIDMAKQALTNAKHDEVKNLARNIISSQQKEIDQMNQWMKDWKYSQ